MIILHATESQHGPIHVIRKCHGRTGSGEYLSVFGTEDENVEEEFSDDVFRLLAFSMNVIPVPLQLNLLRPQFDKLRLTGCFLSALKLAKLLCTVEELCPLASFIQNCINSLLLLKSCYSCTCPVCCYV